MKSIKCTAILFIFIIGFIMFPVMAKDTDDIRNDLKVLGGLSHIISGNCTFAMSLFNEVLASDPNHAGAWSGKGDAFDCQGKYKDAIVAYDRSLSLVPRSSHAIEGKGVAFLKIGEYDRAVEMFQQALEISPNDGYAWYNLGLAYDNLGKFQEAVDAYDHAGSVDTFYVEYAAKNRDQALQKISAPTTTLKKSTLPPSNTQTIPSTATPIKKAGVSLVVILFGAGLGLFVVRRQI